MSNQNDLFQKIQKVLEGHTEREVTHALLTSLIVAIGVGAETLPRAIAVIDALPTEMKPILRDRWQDFRKHRERSELRAAVNVAGTQH